MITRDQVGLGLEHIDGLLIANIRLNFFCAMTSHGKYTLS